ncbi:flagellar hook-associated protein FlgL [Castellaniella sp.]|uniref:flagellar hook-associated protein FlgL n=1 Tax=Castellaniella sp. TaxID=1955812 RepID=UPI0035603BA7
MRISSELVFRTGLQTIQQQQADFLHLYQTIGTGQKMVTPADDPLAASQAINLSQSQSLNQRYAANRSVARQALEFEESALGALTLSMQDLQTRLVEAGNGTLSDADRRSLAGVLANLRDTMLGIANKADGSGQYLFSGSRGDVPAYSPDGLYAGDELPRLIQADQTRQIDSADNGRAVFERAQPGTRAYLTAAAAGNAGTAVLAQPAIQDIQQGNIAAEYAFTLVFDGDQDYHVDIRDGQGALVQTLAGQWQPPAASLDLGMGTHVQISGQPQAGDQFEIRPLRDENLNLFQTLDTLVQALGEPIQNSAAAQAQLRNQLNTAMQKVSSLYDNVLTVRASTGMRLNELEALDDTGAQRDLGYRKALSDLEDLDYYQASIQLNLRKAALMGATDAFQAIQDLSLFNLNQRR